MREVIPTPIPGLDLRREYGHHQSPAIRAGGMVFCSGMVAIDPQSGERQHGTVTSEARRIFENLKLLLESTGLSLDRLVQVHAMIYDRIEYDVLNRLYRQYVPNAPPARTVMSVQIEAGNKGRDDLAHATSRRRPRSEPTAARSADKTAHADRGRSNWRRMPAHAAAMTWKGAGVRPRRRRAPVAGPRATLATRRRDQPW